MGVTLNKLVSRFLMKLHRKAYVNRARNCPFSNVGEQHFTVRGARFRCVYEARPRDLGMC